MSYAPEGAGTCMLGYLMRQRQQPPWLVLFLEWLLLEADHQRALRHDDWNRLHVYERSWEQRAADRGWNDPPRALGMP